MNNLLDGVMVLYQNFISSGITALLEDKAVKNHIEISKRINVSLNKKQLLEYCSRYEKNYKST